jgi:hypothetical protein
MPSPRLKSLELALAKLIDSVHTIEKVDNWTSSTFDHAIDTLRMNAAAAEKLLHKPS